MSFAQMETSSSAAKLARIRAFVHEVCRARPGPRLDGEEIIQLEIAVHEAAANIMKHAYRGRGGERILVEAEALDDRVVIRLFDWGEPLDPESLPAPVFDTSRDSGFGLYIIAQAVDDVRYSRDAQGRNCLCLTKKPKVSEKRRVDMELTVERMGDVAVVKPTADRLDVSNVKDFTREITPVLASTSKVVLDLSRVQFVDSSGLGVFMLCLKRANAAGGDLKIAGMTKPVRVLFELVRFHKIIEVYNENEEAVSAFGR